MIPADGRFDEARPSRHQRHRSCGVAGSASAWLIARDDHSTERAIAHNALVHPFKAKAYQDALVYLYASEERIERFSEYPVFHPGGVPPITPLNFGASPPGHTYAELKSYGSRPAIFAFQSVIAAQKRFPNDAAKARASSPKAGLAHAYMQAAMKDRPPYFSALATFEKIVNGELG